MQNTTEKNVTSEWSATRVLANHWRTYVVVFVSCLALACIDYMLTPNMYVSEILISDEHKEAEILVGLDPITSNLKKTFEKYIQDEGMKNPEIYSKYLSSPTLMNKVANTYLNEYGTDYQCYLEEHHKNTIGERVTNLLSPQQTKQERLNRIIKNAVRYKFYPRHSTIKLQVRDNDAYVATLMVDCLCAYLRQYLDSIQQKVPTATYISAKLSKDSTEARYIRQQKEYAHFADIHTGNLTPGENVLLNKLAKDRDVAFEQYQSAYEKMIREEMLLQITAPSFTVIQPSTQPPTPDRPRLIIPFLFFEFVGMIFTTWFLLYKYRPKTINETHRA